MNKDINEFSLFGGDDESTQDCGQSLDKVPKKIDISSNTYFQDQFKQKIQLENSNNMYYNNNNYPMNQNLNVNVNVYNLNNVKAKNLCVSCINNYVECPNCKGFYKLQRFYEKHETFCNLLHQIYKEKEDLVDCSDCHSLVKFTDYNKHKETCPAARSKKLELMKCAHCSIELPIDMIYDHETQCAKILTEKMLLKEKIECSFCKESIPFSYIESHETSCLKLKEYNEKIEKVSLACKVDFPPEWGLVKEDLQLTSLYRDSEEWQYVEDLMLKSVPNANITGIQLVKNKYLWEKYSREKSRIMQEKRQCDENFLFHGTRANDPKIVYTTGFDISFSSDGGSYGRGIYFARRAAYSCSGYAYTAFGKNYIFLAKVLTGLCIQIPGNSGLRKPPFYDQSKFVYYDSVTNVQNKNNSYDTDQMIIVYGNEKAYPYYLIEFDYNKNNLNNNPYDSDDIYGSNVHINKRPYVNPNVVMPPKKLPKKSKHHKKY